MEFTYWISNTSAPFLRVFVNNGFNLQCIPHALNVSCLVLSNPYCSFSVFINCNVVCVYNSIKYFTMYSNKLELKEATFPAYNVLLYIPAS